MPGPKPPRAGVGNGQVLELSITLNLKTISEANATGQLRAKMARKKAQRGIVRHAFAKLAGMLPAIVTLKRIGPRMLDDDNLRSALKAVRDGLADVIGVDDGDARYRWTYEQCPASAHTQYRFELKASRRIRMQARKTSRPEKAYRLRECRKLLKQKQDSQAALLKSNQSYRRACRLAEKAIEVEKSTRLCKRFFREEPRDDNDIRQDFRYWTLRKFGYDCLGKGKGNSRGRERVWRWWCDLHYETRGMLVGSSTHRLVSA